MNVGNSNTEIWEWVSESIIQVYLCTFSLGISKDTMHIIQIYL